MNAMLNPTTINARLAQLRVLFGPPPVLSSENAKAYDEMLHRFIECFEPQDFFETVLMKDIADGTWESARYSRHKVLLLDRRYRERREAEAKRRKEAAQTKAELARRVAASKGEPATEPMEAADHLVAECDAILVEPATELDHNRLLEVTLVYMEKLDKAQLIALAKRNKALDQLEWYREGLGRRMRTVSDDFIAEHAGNGAAPPQLAASGEETIDGPSVQPQ
jgi:hypothetical protein